MTELAGGRASTASSRGPGCPGSPTGPGSLLVSVNYFGTVALLEGLRPAARRGRPPGRGRHQLQLDDRAARRARWTWSRPASPATRRRPARRPTRPARSATYPATKTAIAWWVRRHAPGARAGPGAGITLNVVAPGAVETPLLQASREDPTIGQFIDAFPIPVGRKGTADELAAFVAFLLGPDARFFCGSVLFVDGGTDALLRPDDQPATLVKRGPQTPASAPPSTTNSAPVTNEESSDARKATTLGDLVGWP